MDNITIKVDQKDSGKRLDIYLTEHLLGEFSRSQIKHLIEEKKVLVNKQNKKAHFLLLGDEVIQFSLPDIKKPHVSGEDIKLDIIYEDDDILVVNKPSGMVVHPAVGSESHTLVNALLFHTKNKLAHLDNDTRPGIVHRLDKEVSGLMVVAKTDIAYKGLVDSFKTRSIKKTYVAFLKGIIQKDQGITELPIGRASRDRKKMAVRFFNSKAAITKFKVLKRFSGYTKVRVNIETGRTHQIRVHMSYMGTPIIGDTKYGGERFDRIALYAAELQFTHPVTGKLLEFKIDMPGELKSLDASPSSKI